MPPGICGSNFRNFGGYQQRAYICFTIGPLSQFIAASVFTKRYHIDNVLSDNPTSPVILAVLG